MWRRVLVLVLFAALAPAHAAQSSASQTVRIGILINQDGILVQSEGSIEAGDVATQAVQTLAAGAYEFRSHSQGIDGGINRFGPVVRLRAAGPLQVGLRRYRGLIEIRRTPSGKLTAINELDLEEYLYGVIKMEMDPRFSPEALRAQAVAARTYALQNLGRFAAEGYDLRATTDSQAYGGITAEDPRTTAAVEATRDLVMTFAGRPILAVYHTDSGGATESSEFVWGSAYPYLRGVPDPYGEDSPAREWLSRIDLPTLETRVQRAGRPVQRISGIVIIATTPSGRVQTVRITGAHGALDLRGTDLRTMLGVSFLRSTLFTVRMTGDETPAVEFHGRGSGHGVGMSQWGARGQALRGRTYPEILQYYYQGVTLETR